MSVTELTIESLATGGDGVGRADGLVVFVPRAAPGDLVEVDLRVQGRVGRGHLTRVLRAGPSRVEARCAHYATPDRCGGCQWQHVGIDAQRQAKAQIVRDAFARIAKRDVPLPTVAGGEPWRYRRTLTLAIRREAGRTWAGLRAFDDPEAVFDLADCEITDLRVVETWREILRAERSLPAGPRLRGTVRFLDGRALFTLEGGEEWPAIDPFLQAVPSVAAVWWQGEGKRRRLVADRRAAATPGASFVQVNEDLATAVQDHTIQLALGYSPRRIIDAYSGSGDVAVRLQAAGVQVAAVELDEEASAFAASRLTAPSRAIVARVEDMLPRLLPADVVILNPPRAGVDARVAATLSAAMPRPSAIIYVSCDPATLARDVARLEGWTVRSLKCFDLFPQTAHIETVCELVPAVA